MHSPLVGITFLAWIHGTLFISSLSGQGQHPFGLEAQQVYRQIIGLDFDHAAKSLIKTQNTPEDATAQGVHLLLQNELDFYQLFLTGSPDAFKSAKTSRDKRLKLLDKSRLSNPWRGFIEAELNLHWAMLHIKFGEEIKGIQLLISAKNTLETLEERHPEFLYYKKSLGILKALLGSIPPEYQWAVKLIGLDGDVLQGKAMLGNFIAEAEKEQAFFLEEAIAAYSFIVCYFENKPAEAFRYWSRKMVHTNPGPLLMWVEIKLALKAGHNEGALLAFNSAQQDFAQRLPELSYLRGLAHLQNLNYKQADESFAYFLNWSRGKERIKETWQKRAWTALLMGNRANYHLCMSNSLTQGTNFGEGDQQAYQEAKDGRIPDTLLLKARLLCDGGYGSAALQLLLNQRDRFVNHPELLLEYDYRLARIYQLLNQKEFALASFSKVLATNAFDAYLYANAQLQSGLLLESTFQKEKALEAFEKVLQLNPDRYRRSIHQQAKSAIARLKSK